MVFNEEGGLVGVGVGSINDVWWVGEEKWWRGEQRSVKAGKVKGE